MGMDASAGLAFGIDLGEERPFEYNDDTDLGEYLAARAGMESPYTLHADEINSMSQDEYSTWKRKHPEFTKAVDAYHGLKGRLEAAAPIEIVHHCSYEVSMYIVALKGTKVSTYWGKPKEIKKLDPPPWEKISAARRFCIENKLPLFENPSWLLYAMWG